LSGCTEVELRRPTTAYPTINQIDTIKLHNHKQTDAFTVHTFDASNAAWCDIFYLLCTLWPHPGCYTPRRVHANTRE